MSQQYQKFKQMFINHQQHYQQSSNKFNIDEINSPSQKHKLDDHLTIQQQSHYPFQQFHEGENLDFLKQLDAYKGGSRKIGMGLNQVNYEDEEYDRGFQSGNEFRQSNQRQQSQYIQFQAKGNQRNSYLTKQDLRPNYFSSKGNLKNHLLMDANSNRIQGQTNLLQQEQSHSQSNSKCQSNIKTELSKMNTPCKQLPIIYASSSPKVQTNLNLIPINNIPGNHNHNPSVLSPNSRLVMQSEPQNITTSVNRFVSPVSREQSRIVIEQQKPIISIPQQTSNRITLGNNYYPPRTINSNQPLQIALPINEQFIPLHQYERLRAQCLMWQQKCLQLQSLPPTEQMRRLKQQNGRLLERIKQFESGQKRSIQTIQEGYQIILRKYQQSLTKQTELLLDRCRLEIKQNQRLRFQTQDQFSK